jgi:L-lysine 6-transaminase
MHEEKLVESAAEVGAYFKEGLHQLEADFEAVNNVRGRGLFLAMDLPDGEMRGKVWKECWDRGVAVLSCGPQSIRFRPPLVFSRENVDQTLATLRTALELVTSA